MTAPLGFRERAAAGQRAASDPAVSAFVDASAGAGKTKLLTDRLLRLMLGGVRPERIQCLTFTKAAAAEMSLRLQRTLGSFVAMNDVALDVELVKLAVEPTANSRVRARALFAQVLDLPGGMRIGTIHAFCQSLLRRFPLEAALSPHFQLVEERDAATALADARETMLARAATQELHKALAVMAGLATAEQFGRHVTVLGGDRDRLEAALELGPAELAAAQRRALGLTEADDMALLASAVRWSGEEDLRRAARRLAERGANSAKQRAGCTLDWLGLGAAERIERWDSWTAIFLTAECEPRAASNFVNPKLADAEPALVPIFLAEAERVQQIEDTRRGLRMAAASHALVTLAAPVLRAYAQRKDASGLLDYDDLIDRTSHLLVDPGAAWVLYKLDGGLDHLLLDEVQDTAPAQWRIAHAMTAEFFAGSGAREQKRTVFAVGDRKQSIYSFQGADADEFDRSRALLAARVRDAGATWEDAALDVSFRSTEPVLALVDAVFADPVAADGVCRPGFLRHYAERARFAGGVELWPLAPAPEQPATPAWTVPAENQGMKSAAQTLAEALAQWIREQTSGGVLLESRGRALRAGDVMVLVRRRNEFARALLRALKSCGVKVAGLDRLVLTEQPAVQDVMALCDALLLPEDDLAFACFLTSPLGGLDDDSLMALAIDRQGSLWEALRTRAAERPEWQWAAGFFATLLGRTDYASLHALLSEALGPLGGRARLFARLGPEAGEPVDELLNAALSYGRLHPPSLQAFLHWLRHSGAEVKREQEAAGEAVRIITVHGAKGLQSPLVVLPDTTALPPDDSTICWAPDPKTGREVPLWSPRKELRCASSQRFREFGTAARMQEHNRLLYVALTRAEDRLVVCGWQPNQALPESCWYRLVERGFDRLEAVAEPFGTWPGMLRRHESAQTVPPRPEATQLPATTVPLPQWAGSAPEWQPLPPPPEPARPDPLAPSRPEGVELGAVPAASSPLAARQQDLFRRGRLLHLLLQHLPDLPEPDRAAAARAFLERPGHGLTPDLASQLATEAIATLADPDLVHLFGPESRAEVPLSGVVAGKVVGGLVDRLAVLPDRVIVADFKTGRAPPARAEATPVRYLRQMAAYRAVLRQVFPSRPVNCVLIWTHGARAMTLPDSLLDQHEPSHAACQG